MNSASAPAGTATGDVHERSRYARQAFTLIELMIVIAIIAIIAAIAIPNLIESRITSAESTAATNLRTGIFSAQEVFRSGAHNDLDGDNRGEYGHLGQLSGVSATWGTPANNQPGLPADNLELLAREFAGPDPARHQPGTVADAVNGYVYASFLDADSSSDPFVDAVNQQRVDNAEAYFAASAAPSVFNDSGRRSFAITNAGLVLTAAGSEVFENRPEAILDSATNGIACYDTVESAVTRANRRPHWANR